MSRLPLVAVLVALSATTAAAEPMARFGLTFGLDRNAPEAHEVGPLIGVGASAGRFTGEANYTYLSFFGYGQTIHRLGVALRSDVYRSEPRGKRMNYWSLFGELGVARKWGNWRVDDMIGDYTSEQNEVHAGFGFALNDRANRASWQLGLRIGLAKRDPMLDAICRGVTCPVAMPASTGLAESVMLEWTWLLNR